MFQLDDQFLKDLGLDQLPEEQRQAFLEHIYSELELRVGVRLSEGLSEQQLSEFESFVDRKDDKVNAWITANVPDYANDQDYVRLRQSAENALQLNGQPKEALDHSALLAEFASLKWLGLNRPNYREVVAQVLAELKQEIMSNRDTILGTPDSQAA